MEEELRLFSDLPLFERAAAGKPDDSVEQFGHEAYANTLYEVLRDNEEPFTIGFFGEWGAGKTTVIYMLLKKLREADSSNICTVLFNAWRHTGDSFRRQLLIAVGKKVYGEGDKRYRELTELSGVGESLVSREGEEKSKEEKISWGNVLRGLRDLWKSVFRSSSKSDRLLQLAILIWMFIVFLGLLGVKLGNEQAVTFLTMVVIMPIILVLFGVIEKGTKHKLIASLRITQPAAEKARLSYPEQFQAEFEKCLKEVSEVKKQRLLVIVDDVDRCDNKTVIDALSVIKQFAGRANCAFIVPCDEKQVLKAVNEGNDPHDYRYESLRKFFDVSIRMDKILQFDLHNYAKELVAELGISPEIAEIAVFSGARDARKVKSFLNAFRTRYWMITEREKSRYYDEGTAAKNVKLIAKLTGLQEQFPDFYTELCKDPSMLDRIEDCLRQPQLAKKEDVKSSDKEAWGLVLQDKMLDRFLRNTSGIDLTDISDILLGKLPESIAGIPNGPKIKGLLSEGNKDEFVAQVKGLGSVQANKLVDFVERQVAELQQQGYGMQARTYIECCFALFSDDIWADEALSEPRRKLADAMVVSVKRSAEGIIRKVGNIAGVEKILEATSKNKIFGESIVQAYLSEPLASDAKEYIELINRNQERIGGEFEKVNDRLAQSIEDKEEEETALELLISVDIGVKGKEAVPSEAVVTKICGSLKPEEADIAFNKKRCDALGKYGSKANVSEFFKVWNELTKAAQSSDVALEGNFQLWLDTSIELSKYATDSDAAVGFPSVMGIWNHNPASDVRGKLVEIITHLYPVLSGEDKQQVAESVAQWLSGQPAEEVRAKLGAWTGRTVSEVKSKKLRALKSLAVVLLKHLVVWLDSQASSYDDRIKEVVDIVCEFKDILDDEQAISVLVTKVITSTTDEQFEKWNKGALHKLCDILSNQKVIDIGETTLEKIEKPETSKVRRVILLDVLVGHLIPGKLTGQNTDKVFMLLWSDSEETREPICEEFSDLEEKLAQEHLKRNMYFLADKIATESVEKVTEKANSVRILLAHASLLRVSDSKRVMENVSRFIQSANMVQTIKIGLEIAEKIEIKDSPPEDLVSALRVLADHDDKEVKESVDRLSKKFGISLNPEGDGKESENSDEEEAENESE